MGAFFIADSLPLPVNYLCMKTKSYVLALLLAVATSIYSQTGTTTLETFVSGGVTRNYRLYIPKLYKQGTKVPLLLNIHGYTSNASQQEMYGDFRKIADTENFIIIHPEGLGTNGGASALGWTNFYPMSMPNNDLIFLSALIDSTVSKYSINTSRIYSTGMSNGGFMSYDLACFLSNKIAAVASVTGSMSDSHFTACNPNRPVPVMQIHGTNDVTVKFDGTPGNIGGVTTPIETLVQHWVNHNNCNTTPVKTNVPNTNLLDNCTAEHYVYSGGDKGSSVEFYKVIGGDHSWPGASFNINTTNMDFSASAEIWRFFSQYTLPTEIDENTSSKNDVLIYPNPSNGFVNVSVSNTTSVKLFISINDITGREVFSYTNEQCSPYFQKQINLAGVSTGVYFIKTTCNTNVNIQKLVVQ